MPTLSYREMAYGCIWYSPLGWEFYSPWWVFDAPFFGYGLGYGYGYGRGRHDWDVCSQSHAILRVVVGSSGVATSPIGAIRPYAERFVPDADAELERTT